MKKKSSRTPFFISFCKPFSLLLILAVIIGNNAFTQGYIRGARAFGLSGADAMNELVVDNDGNSFILFNTISNIFPVTIPPATTGGFSKTALMKLDPAGNILWSRYLPMSATATGATAYSKMVLDNGTLHLLGTTASTDVATTDGSSAGGGGSDILYGRVDAFTGAVTQNSYLGGDGTENSGLELIVDNGFIYLTYTTTSSNIAVTTGPAFSSGFDHVIQKMDLAGNIVYRRYTGSASPTAANTEVASFKVENGLAYLGIVVNAMNGFTTTNGTSVHGNYDFGLLKLDASGNTAFSTVFGGTGDETRTVIDVHSGEIFLSGYSNSVNYLVTNGSSAGPYPGSHVVTKFYSSGSRSFSSYVTGLTATFDDPRIQWNNGAVYLMGGVFATEAPITPTDNSSGSSYLVKLNAADGQVQFATRFGGIVTSFFSTGSDFVIDNGKIYAFVPITNRTPVVTDGSVRTGTAGIYLAVFNVNGKPLYYGTSRLTGGAATTLNPTVRVHGNEIFYAAGQGVPTNFPVTIPSIGAISSIDVVWANLSLCPPMPTDNTISPLTQEICVGGFTQRLTGNKVAFPSTSMPVVYRNGVVEQQREIVARYQWQASASAGGPWTDITGLGTQKDYSPPPLAATRYYRRVVLPPAGCGDTPVSISPVAEVTVGADLSPTVTAAIFNTCAGTPVDISATVTGGASPYTYSWDNGISSTTADATVTPTGNSVYTLTVTDNNGCQQAGQAIVNAYAADAGPAAISSCAGSPVRIGTAPPAGLAGVTWSWSPATGLDDPNIAQPLASPLTNTTYTLTMTIPVTGGGTCSTIDQVTVNVVTAPVTTEFAGDDKVVCLGGTLTLGLPAEAGFTYTWSPGNYLGNTNASTSTFNAGTNQPYPNSFIYTLTAVKGGCSFTDKATVSVLEVNAGEDLCGPRTVGVGDLVAGVSGKTYLWEKISGPGTITGATNTPTTTVSESVGASTVYRLTVSLLGVSCSDIVEVPECSGGGGGGGSCPGIDIDVVANNNCPSTAFGAVTLKARPANLLAARWTYSWSSSPAGGISAATGTSITLTDNVERDITLTITSVDNPSVSCSKTIHVNAPSWSLPSFTAQNQVICPGGSAEIGSGAVPGYSYSWTNITGPDQTGSNPLVSPFQTASYIVTVTDNVSACSIKDTAIVTVKAIVNAAGADWTVCSNAVIQLGSPALPGYTYSWQPAVAAYQDGTTAASANPRVLVTTSQDFTLTVTDAASGCSKDSTVHITVDGSTNLPVMSPVTICKGEGVMIGNPAINNVTYSWSPAAGLNNAAIAQPIANPLATQIYTLTVTYYDAGGSPICTKTGDVTVTVNSPIITMSDESICPSDALYNLSTGVTVTGAATYAWSPGVLVTAPAALSTTVRANPTQPTTFTLLATDADGCRAFASKTVSPVNAAPVAGSNSMLCVGSSVTLGDASNTGAITWTVSPAIAGTLSSAGTPTTVFTPAAGDAGKTFVFSIRQDVAGCVNTATVSVMVNQFNLPAITPQTVCSGASTTIGVPAQPGISYFWTPETGLSEPGAATTQVLNITSTTAYTLTAVDVNGCFDNSQAVIGVNASSAPAITIPEVIVGVGGTAAPFNPQITPANPGYSYSWTPANRVNNPYIANAAGTAGGIGTETYTLSVTDDNGCTSIAQARLKVVQLVILPVILSRFKADSKNCGIYLNWKVETADRFSHFVVERSADGSLFTPLELISYEAYKQDYFYQDADPGNGKWYYRLRMVDINGSFEYSRVVEVQVNCQWKDKLVVYPNPMGNTVNIKSSKPVKKLLLLSLAGNVVKQQDYNQNLPGLVQLQTGSLMAAGTYILQVWAQDGTVQYVKILKQ